MYFKKRYPHHRLNIPALKYLHLLSVLGEKTPLASPNITLKPRKNKFEQMIFADNLVKLLPEKIHSKLSFHSQRGC